ncbi:hypothetical protein [Aeromicrobium sp. CTD01-1L150]|uniref:hypothetical protein n=1 Tax=Aeromicrobium sp. CTD01-1L150 TaxID=3341830 RepID=UPI0035C0F323
MSAVSLTGSPPVRPGWLLAALALALIVGVIAMHSLFAQAPQSSDVSNTAAVAEHQLAADGLMHHGEGAAQPGASPEHSSMLQDCGGLLAACMALLLSLAGLVRWRRGRSWRVLWLQPRGTTMRLGYPRRSLELLTPRQRTTVLRC